MNITDPVRLPGKTRRDGATRLLPAWLFAAVSAAFVSNVILIAPHCSAQESGSNAGGPAASIDAPVRMICDALLRRQSGLPLFTGKAHAAGVRPGQRLHLTIRLLNPDDAEITFAKL